MMRALLVSLGAAIAASTITYFVIPNETYVEDALDWILMVFFGTALFGLVAVQWLNNRKRGQSLPRKE